MMREQDSLDEVVRESADFLRGYERGSAALARQWQAALEGVLREVARVLDGTPALAARGGSASAAVGQLLGLATDEGRPSAVDIVYPHQPRLAGSIDPDSLAELAAENAQGVRVLMQHGATQTQPVPADTERLAEEVYARLAFDDGRLGRA
jgi:hypothetical protein